ncbi:MAG: zinc ribbon domain-containing protein [Clostridiales bacterium]|nr:zinc ribbon domain-containing protein [Clostridiales bacterium]
MFCMKCGNQIPDGSVTCPVCGAPIENAAPQQAPAAPYAPGQVVPSTTTYDIGGFLKDFTKTPIEACTSRDQSKHFLLGLTFPALYCVLNFIFDLMADYVTTKSAIFNFFEEVIGFAAFFAIIFLLYKVFGVKQVDFLSTCSWAGLALAPYSVMILFTWINSKIVSGMDYKIFSISSVLTAATMVFLSVVLYDYFTTNKTEKGSKMKAMYFAVTAVAVWKFVVILMSWLDNKIFF